VMWDSEEAFEVVEGWSDELSSKCHVRRRVQAFQRERVCPEAMDSLALCWRSVCIARKVDSHHKVRQL